ncbi:hypothetical protein Forpe1208_v014079 [Fusarium oxysporum f. sp. rapae]|uniref:BTB domain-containing protein n=1 Tax=Fusarium oxysporum f. sp. rapae TaxID=485398 RepID=A0A8J5TZN9_FUSOX|nr:hypothetical protein Forpe1208_v014079 [Fusarium oxysporum f. sp. rapae]
MSFSFGSVPSQKSTNTAKLGTWDKPVPTDPLQDYIHNELCEFKTFSFHPDYNNFSLEEHRLEDYKHGKGRNAAHIANPNAENSFAPGSELLIKKTLGERRKMQLLQGSGVEIQVGTKTPSSSWNETKSFKTWCLPINLVSHYSPYLKEICCLNLQESNKRIRLQYYQPDVFGLFVEWMYYGSYESSSSVLISNADAKCWALGDKLRSTEFQNYSMRLLYEQHTRPMFGRPMTCDDVQYVWGNTSPGSKLRNFYMNFVVEHFGSPAKLLGSSTDWDTLLQSQSEIRIPLLDKFRKSTFSPSRVGSIDEYLEPNNFPLNLPSQQKSEPIPLATVAKTGKAPIFNFDEKPAGKKNSPQQREPFPLASRTKNYEGAALKFGWKFGESTDNASSPSIKTFQPKKDSPSELNAEPVLGHANQCITSIGKSDDFNKSPETRKGKEPARGAIDNNKESGLGEAST